MVGENWRPGITEPKEFNFMLRERVKELFHEPPPSSRSRSLPASPATSRRSNRRSASHIPYDYATSLPSTPPSDTPRSLRLSMSELDTPVCRILFCFCFVFVSQLIWFPAERI
jgi:hypothetical protein